MEHTEKYKARLSLMIEVGPRFFMVNFQVIKVDSS